MPRPSLLSIAAILAALSAPALAAPATPPASPPVPAAPAAADQALAGSPDQLYAWGTDHLVSGRWYERAIAQLKAAVAADPKNSRYHLALGCAEADRAASVGYAVSWRQALGAIQGIYPMQLKSWEAAQKDPKDPQYGSPKPQPPPKISLYTKDDYKALTLTDSQASARIGELSKDAAGELAQAVALAAAPQDKAQAEYTQGWALRLKSRR